MENSIIILLSVLHVICVFVNFVLVKVDEDKHEYTPPISDGEAWFFHKVSLIVLAPVALFITSALVVGIKTKDWLKDREEISNLKKERLRLENEQLRKVIAGEKI